MNLIYRTMGVINITPDSFSDGAKYNCAEKFEIKFNELLSWADIIDIGAESSAPFNSAIDLDEEVSRFKEVFFPILHKLKDPRISLSIDTYKAQTFETVAREVHQFWPDTKLIWNDVSGVVDDDLLKLFESDLDFSYVLSHNLCDFRENTLDHMSFLSGEDITSNVISFFKDTLTKINTDREILLDPCFGFSKTREQNHKLMREFSMVAKEFKNKWVYGISRKSFLRFPANLNSKDVNVQSQLDQVQNYFLVDAIKSLGVNRLVFRIHDIKSKNAINSTLSILDPKLYSLSN